MTDRWHLLRNLSEALKGALEPHHRILAQAASAAKEPEVSSPSIAPAVPTATRAGLTQRHNRERRHDCYDQVMALAERGMTKLQIGRELGIDRRTVRRWMARRDFRSANRHAAPAQSMPMPAIWIYVGSRAVTTLRSSGES